MTVQKRHNNVLILQGLKFVFFSRVSRQIALVHETSYLILSIKSDLSKKY